MILRLRSSARFFFCFLAALLLLGGSAAVAVPPTLTEVPGDELKNTYKAGNNVTFRLSYKDPDGDRIKKAQFIDESGGASQDYKTLEGGTADTGQTIVWEVRGGFDKGGHKGYFLVTNSVGEEVRFPEDPDRRYTFTVASVADKWIVTGIGVLVGLLFIPFLIYLIARSANKRGNPSSAARIGLLIGIFAALAIFIYEFIGVYDPLILAMGGVAALALFIIVLTRR
ncbi:MAG: US12 family protein [Cytophagales bacterium]|nr:US12 family protein [Armatimonadota bacterium]